MEGTLYIGGVRRVEGAGYIGGLPGAEYALWPAEPPWEVCPPR